MFWSCANEKTIQLPEINGAKITELQDVSAAYLFYDETQPDSLELNRKNLISKNLKLLLAVLVFFSFIFIVRTFIHFKLYFILS